MKQRKQLRSWKKFTFALGLIIIIGCVAYLFFGWYIYKQFNDDSNLYFAKLKSCGHFPYIATEIGELGSSEVSLVTATKPNTSKNLLERKGYYCSIDEARQAGLLVSIVDGQSYHSGGY
jgi:hypothetical protein